MNGGGGHQPLDLRPAALGAGGHLAHALDARLVIGLAILTVEFINGHGGGL